MRRKLEALAQRRANNTGHAHYVVVDAGTGKTKVKMYPAKIYLRDNILKVVTPDEDTRTGLLKRRKTRGGNRVRVGNNIR